MTFAVSMVADAILTNFDRLPLGSWASMSSHPPSSHHDTSLMVPVGLAFIWVGLEHVAMWFNQHFPGPAAKIRRFMNMFDRFGSKDKRFSVLRKFNSSRWTGRR